MSSIEPLYPELVGRKCVTCGYVFEVSDNPTIVRYNVRYSELKALRYLDCRVNCYSKNGHAFDVPAGMSKKRYLA